MKLLFIGDMHLKINRFQLATQFLNWLDNLIATEKPDLVINLGDTWDTHAVLRSEIASIFMAHVYKTIALNIPYIYVLGNHDQYRPGDSTYHAMLPFKGKIGNLYVVDSVQDLFGITFVPYQHKPESFPKKTLPICVAHQTFKGATYGEITDKDGVDAGSIEGLQLGISGHIHKRQVLGPILYVGSPFSQTSSDIDEVKGITILSTDTLNTAFHACPLPMWRRLTTVLSEASTGTDIIAEIELELSKFPTDHWVLEVTGPKAEITTLLNTKGYLKLKSRFDLKVKPKFVDKEKKQVAIEAKSMEYIISQYVNKVYSGTIDKELLLKQANEVLSEVRQPTKIDLV